MRCRIRSTWTTTTILVQNHHTEDDFRDQLCDQFDVLYRESGTQGGRIMAISLHPWVIGQPYRIKALEDALAHIMRHHGVWAATGSEILDAWTASKPERSDTECALQIKPAPVVCRVQGAAAASGIDCSAMSFQTSWRQILPSRTSNRSMKRMPSNAVPSSHVPCNRPKQ